MRACGAHAHDRVPRTAAADFAATYLLWHQCRVAPKRRRRARTCSAPPRQHLPLPSLLRFSRLYPFNRALRLTFVLPHEFTIPELPHEHTTVEFMLPLLCDFAAVSA